MSGHEVALEPDPGPGSGGLLGKLMAAVRPEFRQEVLVFDPRDPVFGSDACGVAGCDRPERARGLCFGHHQRWIDAGRPDRDGFAAAAGPAWKGHGPVASCRVPGCRYHPRRFGLCHHHRRAWDKAGQPELAGWLQTAPVLGPPRPAAATCRIEFCQLWAQANSPLCPAHHRAWKRHGCPDVDEFARAREEGPARVGEHVDLAPLPGRLRLEIQYALQCRSDDGAVKTRPATVRRLVAILADAGVASLQDLPEEACRRLVGRSGAPDQQLSPLLVYLSRRVEERAHGRGWEIEYPHDVWRLAQLGIHARVARLRFDRIPQPWLKELAKRWVRWRLAAGLGAG